MTAPGLEAPAAGMGLADARRGGAQAPARTGRRRSRALLAVIVGSLVGLALAVTFAVAFLVGVGVAYQGRVLPGVEVSGVDLAGLDQAAATARLRATLAPLDEGELTLQLGGSAAPQTSTERALGRRYDVADAVDAALAFGHDGSLVGQAEAEVRGLLGHVAVTSAIVYDPAAVEALARRAADAAAVAPVSARVLWTSGTVAFAVAPPSSGRALDVAATAAAIGTALQRPGRGDISVLATVQTVDPAVGMAGALAAQAQAEGLVAHPLTLRADSKTWTIAPATLAGWVTFGSSAPGAYTAVLEPVRVAASLGSIASAVARPARDAVFVTKGNDVVGVIASAPGARLDPAATATRIATALAAAARTDQPPVPVDLAVSAVAPKLDSSTAAAIVPRMSVLGAWTTPFFPSSHNYFGANIRLPAAQINGYVLLPGQTFDFWKVVNVSSELGFGPGGIIKNGHTDPTGALGGGICSCSTTLFNAALRAGLQMGARANHYYYIDRYPVGLDATVWKESGGAEQTMSFRNDTAEPILIKGSSTRTSVTFQIYGVPDGRKVTLSKPIVKNYDSPIDTTVHTASLPKGQTYRAEYPTAGFDAWVTRTVTDATGKVIHKETYYSHYARVDGILEIGTG